MTFKVELSPNYDYCPIWWKQLCSNYSSITEYAEMENEINSFIIENGGLIHFEDDELSDGYIDYIEFPSEAHFTWFLLKI